jgi:hypothetical protein
VLSCRPLAVAEEVLAVLLRPSGRSVLAPRQPTLTHQFVVTARQRLERSVLLRIESSLQVVAEVLSQQQQELSFAAAETTQSSVSPEIQTEPMKMKYAVAIQRVLQSLVLVLPAASESMKKLPPLLLSLAEPQDLPLVAPL